ncbi:MAG: PfkB family carbohydrate kinase [Clostridiales bacterium]|nr:PfkB family carbohydrate kinase [Clostridiales bacterium]
MDLYEEDFTKIDGTGLAGDIYDSIPASLTGNASRYMLSNAREGIRAERVRELIPDILSSYTVNIAYHANNPAVGMSLEKDAGRYKLYTSDVGLFVTLAFKDKKYTDNMIYNKLLSDKLETNLGYVYENAVAQMLTAKGNHLFYYTMKSDTSNHLYEIDFILSVGNNITLVFPNQPVERLEELLQPGKLIHMEEADVHTGGSVANTGLALKFLGADVTLMGKTGSDPFGSMVRTLLQEHGVPDGMLVAEGESTSYSMVLVVPGIDRIFLHNPGANDTFCTSGIPEDALKEVALLHFGYPPLMAEMYRNRGEELVKLIAQEVKKQLSHRN